MLGSVHDADDALQDASLRAWRGLSRFEGRSSLRSWLYTIATNTCLTHIERRPQRTLPVEYGPATDPHIGPGEPLIESVWIEPYPDRRARGRAARERRAGLHRRAPAPARHPARRPDPARGPRLLRQGDRRDARDHGRSVNSALQRARATVEERLPERSQQETLRALGDEQLSELVTRTSTRGSAATSTPWSSCSPRTRRSRCRRWPAGSARATRSQDFLDALPA